MLEFVDVTKKYGSKTAVDHVTLTLEPGKIYGMLGPNGSGKSTLMKMAVELVKPNHGQVLYDGKTIGTWSRKDIAYMSTEPYFYNWMSVKDIGKYYQDFFDDFSMDRYQMLISRMDLTMDMKAKTLSSGMMAKLKIAVTMARSAKVYFLDEPLNGIDLLARDEIMKAVLETVGGDVTMVMSSHLVDELEKVIDTAIFMKQSHLVGVWEVEELKKQQNKSIVDLYREIYGNGGTYEC